MKPIKDTAVRESYWIVGSWCVCAVWVLFATYILPATTPQSPRLLFGMPMWIVVGVMLPWSLATIFTIWFALGVMTDDPPPEPQSEQGPDSESEASDE